MGKAFVLLYNRRTRCLFSGFLQCVQMHARATSTPAVLTTDNKKGLGGFYSSTLQRKQTLTEGPSPVFQGCVLESLASLSSQRSWLRKVLWRISFLPSVSLRCKNREARALKVSSMGGLSQQETGLRYVCGQASGSLPTYTSLEAFSQPLGELQHLHFL